MASIAKSVYWWSRCSILQSIPTPYIVYQDSFTSHLVSAHLSYLVATQLTCMDPIAPSIMLTRGLLNIIFTGRVSHGYWLLKLLWISAKMNHACKSPLRMRNVNCVQYKTDFGSVTKYCICYHLDYEANRPCSTAPVSKIKQCLLYGCFRRICTSSSKAPDDNCAKVPQNYKQQWTWSSCILVTKKAFNIFKYLFRICQSWNHHCAFFIPINW